MTEWSAIYEERGTNPVIKESLNARDVIYFGDVINEETGLCCGH